PNRRAWRQLAAWDKPFLVAFSDSDPITAAVAPVLRRVVPGAESVTIAGAGHFLQEDAGEELAAAIAAFVARTEAPPRAARRRPPRRPPRAPGGTHPHGPPRARRS